MMLNIGIDPSTKRDLVIDDYGRWIDTLPKKISNNGTVPVPVPKKPKSEIIKPKPALLPAPASLLAASESANYQNECPAIHSAVKRYALTEAEAEDCREKPKSQIFKMNIFRNLYYGQPLVALFVPFSIKRAPPFKLL